MKKLILLISILFITSACTNINNVDYKDNIDSVIKNNVNNKYYNHSGSGYKYYLPKYMSVKNIYNYNELLNGNDNTYYLYIDIISYYNKKTLKNNNKCDINYEFTNNKLDGFLCVNHDNDKYMVEIVYNYAKIEVKVDKNNLNEVINNSIIILSTVKYDDDLIGSLVKEKKLSNKEESLNIFKDKKDKNDFIEVIEEYDNYDGKDNDIPDYDVIN